MAFFKRSVTFFSFPAEPKIIAKSSVILDVKPVSYKYIDYYYIIIYFPGMCYIVG